MEQREMNREEFEKKLEELQKAALRLDILAEQHIDLWDKLSKLRIEDDLIENALTTGDERELVKKFNREIRLHFHHVKDASNRLFVESLKDE